MLLDGLAKLKYYFLLLEDTIKAIIVFLFLSILAMYLGGVDLTPRNIVLLLTLNYEPQNVFDALAQMVIMFLEFSPIMAFIDAKTLSEEQKAEIKAKLMEDHVILVGCGHLGRRVAEILVELEIPFVLVVLPKDKYRNEVVIRLMRAGYPIIFGDAMVEDTLRRAGVEKARSIIVAINNDTINPVIAEKAKRLNPNIRTIVRIFSDELAEVLSKGGIFDEIISTTYLSSRFFAYGAYFDVVPEESLITIKVHREFLGLNVADLEELGVKIVAIKRGDTWIKFTGESEILEGDVIVVVGTKKSLARLVKHVSKRRR